MRKTITVPTMSIINTSVSVSYTHLDVYKRQVIYGLYGGVYIWLPPPAGIGVFSMPGTSVGRFDNFLLPPFGVSATSVNINPSYNTLY